MPVMTTPVVAKLYGADSDYAAVWLLRPPCNHGCYPNFDGSDGQVTPVFLFF